MAERKPTGFRFRLPWLLQPALTSRPVIAAEPPRTTTQKPPFRPPGIAPPTLATPPPPPASPTRAPPRSVPLQVAVASSPPRVTDQSSAASSPPRVTVKSSAPKSETAKTVDPVANQPTKETQTTSETAGDGETQAATEMVNPATPLVTDKVADAIKTQTASETPGPAVPLAAAGTAADGGGTQPMKETQAATEMANPVATPPAIANTIETQLTKETHTTTIETPAPASPPLRAPPSPVNIQPIQTDTSPRSQSTDKPSSLPSSSSITTSAFPHNTPEINRSKTDSNHVQQSDDLESKPKAIAKEKGTQIKSLNPHSMDKITETKSQKKPKPIASDRVSLHREIKDDIFKFIRKMATSSPKDEKPASVVTVAGDNTGASMHLGSEVNSDRSTAINEEGSSKSSENKETKAIVNSNIQGINNSMMFNSSVTERNPGVHLGFSRNIANNNESKMDNRESMETHRSEANITPQQTLVYDPTIRRCILEGVSLEMELEADDEFKGYEIEVV